MQQAIVSKVLHTPACKGRRIKAKCRRGSFTLAWVEGVGMDEHLFNHTAAVKGLIHKFIDEDRRLYGSDPMKNPWNTEFVTGALPNGDWVHVFVEKAK